MTKLTILLGLLAATGNLATVPQMSYAQLPALRQHAAVMTQDEVKFVELVNEERTKRGLPTLEVDPLLIEVARAHSREMSDKHYFSHTSPTAQLRTPLDRYLVALKHRPSWALVGENLFYCSETGVERGHNALMNSKGHRENILEPKYERIGVGIYTNDAGEFYVTQMFLAKID